MFTPEHPDGKVLLMKDTLIDLDLIVKKAADTGNARCRWWVDRVGRWIRGWMMAVLCLHRCMD